MIRSDISIAAYSVEWPGRREGGREGGRGGREGGERLLLYILLEWTQLVCTTSF